MQNKPMRRSGKLKSWNNEQGFGSIQPAQGGKDVFVHIMAFPPGSGRPTIGLLWTFEVQRSPNYKTRALAVRATFPASSSLPLLLAIPVFGLIWIGVASR